VCQVLASNSARARRSAVVAGYQGDEAAARAALANGAPAVRAAGWGALYRMGALRPLELVAAFADPAPEVRRRACDLAGRACEPGLADALVAALGDSSPAVVEAACNALGQYASMGPGSLLTGGSAGAGGSSEAVEPKAHCSEAGATTTVVEALAAVAGPHPDALCREAAVAALGAFAEAEAGSTIALGAVLAALADKPAVRRRAVVALGAFAGEKAELALEGALSDRDWQVRELAEGLLRARRDGLSS